MRGEFLSLPNSCKVIHVSVCGQTVTAKVDTGSSNTIISKDCVDRLELKIDHDKQRPNCVFGKKVNFLGIVKISIIIGKLKTINKWLPVIDKGRLDYEVLLGADILDISPSVTTGKSK